MLNFYTVYMILGIIFGIFLENGTQGFNRVNNLPSQKFTITHRLLLILAWPVFFVMFLKEFIKHMRNMK